MQYSSVVIWVRIFVFETESHSIDLAEPQTHGIAQADLKQKAILLPRPPKCWDYRHEPLFPSPTIMFTVVEMVCHFELPNMEAVSEMCL